MARKAVFAISIIALLLLSSSLVAGGAFATKSPREIDTHPPIHVKRSGTAAPTGLLPVQIAHAYGFDKLSCYGSNSCGSGQTVAIVDAYDDPNIESDLATFDSQFGLPSCTTANGCFTKATPQGLPRGNTGWALEESLDVEWAHAIAPGAKIILVEAKNSYLSSLLSAVDYAASQPNVHQVSMSWGGSEFSGESSYDYHFNVSGVSFIASSGDSGTGTIYPSASPYVVGVGGTTLNVDSSGNVLSETAWSGSGGGVSSYESVPSYQSGFNPSSGRGIPDVSYDADPNTGIPIYDSYGYGGWNQVGGTSAGAPQWAAISAIVNSGGGQLSSASFGTSTALYKAAIGSAYSANYRDITAGSNGACGTFCNAGPGYDFVTGLGSPLTNNLIPYLQPSPTPDFAISSSPSSMTINLGSSGSSTITVTSLNGFGGTVSLSSSTGSILGASSLTVSSGGTASTTLTITNPTSSGTYTVTATSGSLTHSTTVIVTVPTVPSAPQNLVTTAGNAQVTLTWSAPLSNGGAAISGYNVYRGTTSGGESTTPIATVTTTGYTDSVGLTNGQTYYYYVTAVNSAGQSSLSNEANATPQQTPSLSVSVTTDTSSYTQRTTAFITVTVTSGNSAASGASVTVTVTDPNNVPSSSSGVTNSNGQVTFPYHIGKHAPLGVYTASATATESGYISGSGSATFSVT
ncbi:MAG: fibronectin type III domain-containing protein [Thaumarchaeota archaeon]|nr:fibronectin type III domain-containing protein [Nitrososphaerota archaeon]